LEGLHEKHVVATWKLGKYLSTNVPQMYVIRTLLVFL